MNTTTALIAAAASLAGVILTVSGGLILYFLNRPKTDAETAKAQGEAWSSLNAGLQTEVARLAEQVTGQAKRIEDLEAWKRTATDVLDEMADTLHAEKLPVPAQIADLKI